MAACGPFTPQTGFPSGLDTWKRHNIWKQGVEQTLTPGRGRLALDQPQQSTTRTSALACKGQVQRELAPDQSLSLGPVLSSGQALLSWLLPHPATSALVTLIYDVTPALSSSPPALSPLPALAVTGSQRGPSQVHI